MLDCTHRVPDRPSDQDAFGVAALTLELLDDVAHLALPPLQRRTVRSERAHDALLTNEDSGVDELGELTVAEEVPHFYGADEPLENAVTASCRLSISDESMSDAPRPESGSTASGPASPDKRGRRLSDDAAGSELDRRDVGRVEGEAVESDLADAGDVCVEVQAGDRERQGRVDLADRAVHEIDQALDGSLRELPQDRRRCS